MCRDRGVPRSWITILLARSAIVGTGSSLVLLAGPVIVETG